MRLLCNTIFLTISCLYTSLLASAEPPASTEKVFTNKYRFHKWGVNERREGTSGIGSTLSATEIYREFLQDFLKTFNIQNVVDAGCGDWEFSKAIDWSGIHYSGFDIVKQVIKKNIGRYGAPNIIFKHGNAIDMELPPADLLLCKDVLQHLPNEDIIKFTQQLGKFKYCLITNDVDPDTLTSDNPQIKCGRHRYLDLSQPPFSLNGINVLDYWCVISHKVVFFIDNTSPD